MPDNEATIGIWAGGAERYDAVRPEPPDALLDLLTQLAGGARPRLVVDLGCGSGLSTRVWASRAEAVVGVEPNDDMRRQAEVVTAQMVEAPRVRYLAGASSQTGLADRCADIVTVSQALHWMDPEPTFAEVARILRPRGVFAAYDYDRPPTGNVEAELAFDALMRRVQQRARAVAAPAPAERTNVVRTWRKDEHLTRMRASGHFRYTREVTLHGMRQGDAAWFEAFATENFDALLVQFGLHSTEGLGLDEFRDEVRAAVGERTIPWYLSYRVRLGVK